MDSTLLSILFAVTLVSAISLIGIFALSLRERLLRRALSALVSFAVGSMLGASFFHLLPQAIELGMGISATVYVTAGIVLFFILERFLYWRHCHEEKCQIHAFAYLNLFGDGIHNLVDGMVIAASFMGGIPLGVATTVAIITHEIPQEFGDFGVLLYAGLEKLKALFYNFLSALTAIAGALLMYFSSAYVSDLSVLFIPFAAGGFIYIANSDLVPELHKEREPAKSAMQFILLIAGIFIMWLLRTLEL